MREGDSDKRERLQQAKSLAEVLEVAILFEEAAANFYQLQLERVSKPLRWLLESLVDEERQHSAKLQALRDDPVFEEQLETRIEVSPVDPQFSDAIQIQALDEIVDDQAILQYALGREQLAMDQYRKLAEMTEEGVIQQLFQWLADEEVHHKGYLERRYYELVHRGGGASSRYDF